MKVKVSSGVDNLLSVRNLLKGKKIGLITNPTGLRHDMRTTIDILYDEYCLAALYAPEHGVRGDAQAGVHIGSERDPKTGVMVYSLYGDSRRLSETHVHGVDIIVFDIQDVGARYYTYLYTLGYAMESCKYFNIPMVVLDRANPIGGVCVSGTILDECFHSFIGEYAVPARYGLTIGEFARYLAGERATHACELTVVPLSGWQRSLYYDDTDLPWILPSPNMPTVNTAILYVGMCLFEGTNLSEGRGTTIPFEIIGAPWLQADNVVEQMQSYRLPGVAFRSACFTPVFGKFAGSLCKAIQVHIIDRETFEPFSTGLYLLDTIRTIHPDDFSWAPPWQENGMYVIDLLLGTDEYRTCRVSASGLVAKHKTGVAEFDARKRRYHLYD